MSNFRLYWKMMGVSIRTQMAYRVNFLLSMLTNCLSSVIMLVGMALLFDRFHAIAGWQFEQVLVFYGMAHIALSSCEMVLRGFDVFDRHVNTGEFDRILLRPRGTFFQVLSSECQLMRFGRLLQGAAAIAYGLFVLQPGWGAPQWLLFFASLLGGMVLFGGITIIRAVVCFWTVESLEVFEVVLNGGVEAAQYPMDVYSGALRKFFTYVVPMAAINYWPLCALFGKQAVPPALSYASPLFGFAFFGVSALLWRFGVSRYQSTGN